MAENTETTTVDTEDETPRFVKESTLKIGDPVEVARLNRVVAEYTLAKREENLAKERAEAARVQLIEAAGPFHHLVDGYGTPIVSVSEQTRSTAPVAAVRAALGDAADAVLNVSTSRVIRK